MRITGGFLKGRIIRVPSIDIRPAMDRMRESIFAVLSPYLQGSSFLDLFSGSGIMAIEAISRGAERVVCIEKDPRKRAILKQNLSLVGERAKLHIMPVERYLRFSREKPFHIVFLDPPFPYAYKSELLDLLASSSMIQDGTIVLIHYPKEESLPDQIGSLRLTQTRPYGRSRVSFYRVS
ncbi:MAG: 16S rRNA (guanine(966)-N(2))-methyltransferase RsmD [Spirochaetales bacterium]